MDIREAVIVDAIRTPIGRRGGQLSNQHPVDLLAHVLNAVIDRTGVDADRIDDVIAGCVTQVGEQSTNFARNAVVAAGLPQTIPATTVDRQCGSSQQAVHFAAQGVMAGAYDLVLACGAESMSRIPMASNVRGGTGPFPPSFLRNADLKLQFQVSEKICEDFGISREDLDAYSVESHRRAHEATTSGHFAREIVGVPLVGDDGEPTGEVMTADEGIRPGTDLETLAGLRAVVEDSPRITAGNSSQVSDGAAAMLIASRQTAEELGLPIRARFTHFTVAADDATWVLTAPNPATRKALKRSGMEIGDFDAFEVNEAFAAIALMWAREFGPEPERLNPRGGAIAIGHPLGCSGVRLMTTLLNHLEATDGRFGLQTMCEGGGQANVTIIERLG